MSTLQQKINDRTGYSTPLPKVSRKERNYREWGVDSSIVPTKQLVTNVDKVNM